MAKKTQTELLEGILLLLDQTLGEAKKKNKAVGDSNAPKGAGVVNAKDISVKTLGDALSIISSAVPKLAKISEKQYDTVAKGIEKIAAAINSFKMDKDTLAGVSNMVSAFVQIHNVISGMSENFIKSILSLNPIKAWILGKRLGRFYGLLAKGMTSEFVKQLVGIINQVPPNEDINSKTFKERLVNFGLMMAALLQIKEKQIMQLWFMGVMLGPKIGKAIGGFFKELIDKLAGGRNGVEKAKAAAKVALSVAALVGTLSLCLIALVILWKTNDIKDLLGGFGLLTLVVVFALGIIQVLGSDKFKKSAIEGLDGVKMVLLLIGGLTLTLVILVAVGKSDIAVIGKGLLLFATVVGTAILLMRVLASDKFKQQSVESLMGVGAILLLVLGLSVVALFTDKFAKDWKKRLFGMAILAVFVAASIGVLFLLSLVAKNKETTVNALIGTAAIVLMIAGVSGAVLIFGEFLKKLNGITTKTILWGIGLTVGMIVGMGAIAFAAGALITGPQAILFYAGFAAIETIAIMIASISGAMLLFTNFLKDVSGLKKEDIEYAIARITEKGGMIDCLMTIVNALDENIRWKAAPKIAMIGLALRPLMTSLSQFVDVVQKMASLKIADEWDKNGRPTHYLKLEPKAFKDAADNLTDAFSTFISKLVGGLDGITDSKGLKRILKTLFPRNKKRSGGIGNVIRACSDFVDVVIKMATLLVPDEWDNEGNPKHYRKLKNSEFGEAASTLSEAFSTFLTKLGEGMDSLSIKSAAILKILGGDISAVLQGVGAAFGPIIQIAAGKIQVGDKVVDINETKLKGAASIVVSILGDILKFLGQTKAIAEADWNADKFKDTMVDFIDGIRDIDILQKIAFNKNNNVNNLISGLNIILSFLGHSKTIAEADWNADKFKDALEDFCDGVKYLNNIKQEMFLPKFAGNTSNLINGLNGIVQYLNDTNFKTAKSNSAIFKDVMKNTANGVNHIKPFLTATPKQIVDLANAMKQLDAELIAKEEQRTKAIQSVASNFKDMAAGVNQLNKAMAESMRLTRLYDQMKSVTSGNIIAKGVSAAVEGAGAVASKVKEALNDNKSEEQQKAKEEAKQKDREELAAVIGNAVSAALAAWSESHKDLTVQFSDSPEKIFGEIRNG